MKIKYFFLIKKTVFVLSFIIFISSRLMPIDSDLPKLDGLRPSEFSVFLDKKAKELSVEISGTVIEYKVYLSNLILLINKFIKTLKSDFDSNLKPYEIRKAKREVAKFELLIKEKVIQDKKYDFFSKTLNVSSEKILYLLDFLKMLLDNPDLVDKSALTLFLDLTYHRPVEFVVNNKVGASIFLILATLSGFLLPCLKKKLHSINAFSKAASEVSRTNAQEENNSFLLGAVRPSVSKAKLDREITNYRLSLEAEEVEEKNRLNSYDAISELSGFEDFEDFIIEQNDLLSDELNTFEADVDDVDRIPFARETNSRYDFRQPKLNMSLRFKEVVDDSNKYKKYSELFDC